MESEKERFSQAPCEICGRILPKGQIQCPRCWKPKGERHGSTTALVAKPVRREKYTKWYGSLREK